MRSDGGLSRRGGTGGTGKVKGGGKDTRGVGEAGGLWGGRDGWCGCRREGEGGECWTRGGRGDGWCFAGTG